MPFEWEQKDLLAAKNAEVGARPWEEADLLAAQSQDMGIPEWEAKDLAADAEKGQGFWRSMIENPEEKIPFVGGVVTGYRFADVVGASKRLQDPELYGVLGRISMGMGGVRGILPRTKADVGQVTAEEVTRRQAEDVKTVEAYLREANKKYTSLGQVGRIVGEMPAFMIEFLATGGLKKLGEKGAVAIAEKLLKGQAKHTLTKAGVGLAKYMSGAALRSVGLPQRAVVAVLKRQLPQGISYGPNGEINIKDSGENPWMSIIKGLGDHYIEILSEQAGEIVAPAMGRALKRIPFMGKLLSKMQSKWLSTHKSKKAIDFLNKIGTKVGFDGIIVELGEEFYGDQLRAIFDIDDFGAGEDAGLLERMNAAFETDIKNLPVMAAAFLVPGVGRAALGFAGSRIDGDGTPPITQQGTEAVSEAVHHWTEEEFDTTFGAGLGAAVTRLQAGELTVSEITKMSEVREIEEREAQGVPSIAEQIVGADEFENLVVKQTTAYIKEGFSPERARFEATKTVSSRLEEEFGAKQIQSQEAQEDALPTQTTEKALAGVTPEKSTREYHDQKKFELPKTTAVTEIAKLVSIGLSVDDAVATIQDLRTSKTQEVTHKDQTQIEVGEIAEVIKKANPNTFDKEIIGSQGSVLQEVTGVAKDKLTRFHWGHMRISRMLEWLDGKQEGPLKDYIWKPMRAAVAQSATGRAYRIKQLHDILEEFGLTIEELYKKNAIEIRPGKTLRPVDMLEVFLATKDTEKLRNLKEGNGFTDEDIQDTLAVFIQDERMLHLGHWLLGQYSADYTEIAEKYNKTTGNELPRIPGYSAIRRRPEGKFARYVTADQESDALLSQLLGGLTAKKKGVAKGMTMARTHATGPLELDALSNYVAHTRAVEHYKAMAIPAYNIDQMLTNKEFQKAVQVKTRGAGNRILSKWLRDVVAEQTSLENDWVSRVLGVLRRNAVVSALGINVITAMKQPLSLSLAAAENPRMIPGIMAAFAEGARSPSALKKFVHDRSVVVRHRNMEREMREMAQRRSVRKKIGMKRTLSEKSLFLIRWMDQATVQVVWKAAYDMKMRTQTEEQAIAYADSVIERTQPMADIMDLPHFFRGSELHKMFTLFQNQINQNYNYWAHDILGATKRGEISKEMLAYRVLMSTILPATFLGLISRGFSPPDDPKEWAKDMASFMVAPIFMFGRVASAILNGYDPSSMVGFGWAKELYDAKQDYDRSQKAKTLVTQRAGEQRALVHVGGAAAKAIGVPWSQPKRFLKGVIAINEMETDDPRRLIWSQYALEGGKKKPKTKRLRRKIRKRRTR